MTDSQATDFVTFYFKGSCVCYFAQATDFVTFYFKGSCVCYFAIGSTDHLMNFFSVHNVAK